MPKKSKKKTLPVKMMVCPECGCTQLFSIVKGAYRCPICGFTKPMKDDVKQ